MYVEKPRQRKSLHYGTSPSAITSIGGKNTSDTHNIIDDKDTYG